MVLRIGVRRVPPSSESGASQNSNPDPPQLLPKRIISKADPKLSPENLPGSSPRSRYSSPPTSPSAPPMIPINVPIPMESYPPPSTPTYPNYIADRSGLTTTNYGTPHRSRYSPPPTSPTAPPMIPINVPIPMESYPPQNYPNYVADRSVANTTNYVIPSQHPIPYYISTQSQPHRKSRSSRHNASSTSSDSSLSTESTSEEVSTSQEARVAPDAPGRNRCRRFSCRFCIAIFVVICILNFLFCILFILHSEGYIKLNLRFH